MDSPRNGAAEPDARRKCVEPWNVMSFSCSPFTRSSRNTVATPAWGRLAQSCNPCWFRGWGLFALAVALLGGGCATGNKAGVVISAEAEPARNLGSVLGTVVLTGDSALAKCSFDKADGQRDLSRDRAGLVAGNVLALSTPDALVNLAVGAGTLIVAPFLAANAAITARHRLNDEQLADSEKTLASAMLAMAKQSHFRQRLLQAANDRRPGQLLSIDQAKKQRRQPMDAALDAQVEELRLERATSSDASYTLRIKARIRLVRSDGTVLYDHPAEYRSEPGLFIDWARQPSVQNVADTGYRILAQHLVDQVLAASDTPLLIGAGYRSAPGFDRYSYASQVSSRTTPPSRVPASAPPSAEFIQRVDFALNGTLGIYSTASVANVHLQRPQTRQEAHEEALQDVEWMMDGLNRHPNTFVALPAQAVAVPISLWKQGVAAVRGLAPRTVRNADATLNEAAAQTQPHQEIAVELAQCLKPATSQRVMLVKQPFPRGAEQDPDLLRCLSHGTLTWLPEGQTVDGYLISQGAETALEIRVLSANLEGPAGINPKLALSVEAQAVLQRPGVGQWFCSCPVRYRGQGRTFTEWAARDAEAFRRELRTCYQQLSAALADQLVQRGLVPEKSPATLVNAAARDGR